MYKNIIDFILCCPSQVVLSNYTHTRLKAAVTFVSILIKEQQQQECPMGQHPLRLEKVSEEQIKDSDSALNKIEITI